MSQELEEVEQGVTKMTLRGGETRRRKKKLTLITSDGKQFKVGEDVILQSGTITEMTEDEDCVQSVVPVANVTGDTLEKVIEYCKMHAKKKMTNSEDLDNWDAEFINVDMDTLHDLLLAAHFLEVKGLMDLICGTVANLIKGKQPEQIREIFGIQNDFTPEEEKEIRDEHPWAFHPEDY